ncbi:MAG: hypothetical protein ICV83_00455 [Cytophagales bacterium]|nr:hypothetical protein [Cytophagales bacterium]
MHPSAVISPAAGRETVLPPSPPAPWPWYGRLAFRFGFLFLVVYIAPWLWLTEIPLPDRFTDVISERYNGWLEVPAGWVNAYVFGNPTLLETEMTGSGDRLYDWALYVFFLLFAAAGALAWTVLDRRRRAYDALYSWLRVLVRYNLALFMAVYGFLKIFPLQMPEPLLSQLGTPLGEFTPMRLAWLFIGQSRPYEFFSGFVEVLGGALLLFQRTTTLGACLLLGVLTNVFLLNVAYDIPVKLFSGTLLLMTLLLVLHDGRRLLAFFVLNRPATPVRVVQYSTSRRGQLLRTGLKLAFFGCFFVAVCYDDWQTYAARSSYRDKDGIFYGVYQVQEFRRNNQPAAPFDTLTWQNVIFEKRNLGSIGTGSAEGPALWYGRDYFSYEPDTLRRQLAIDFHSEDTRNFVVQYSCPDSLQLLLRGKSGPDSLYVRLRKSPRSFPLRAHGFHWVSQTPW